MERQLNIQVAAQLKFYTFERENRPRLMSARVSEGRVESASTSAATAPTAAASLSSTDGSISSPSPSSSSSGASSYSSPSASSKPCSIASSSSFSPAAEEALLAWLNCERIALPCHQIWYSTAYTVTHTLTTRLSICAKHRIRVEDP